MRGKKYRSLDKRQSMKLVLSIFLLVIGTLGSIYLSVYAHLLFTRNLSGIKMLNIFQIVKILVAEEKARYLFLILELLVLTASTFSYFMKDSFYASELMEIAPNIKIPKPAGQMQFGSARFITDREKDSVFTICEIDPKDKLIKDLMRNKKMEGNKGGDEDVKIKYSILQRRWHCSGDRQRSERKV